MVGVEMLDVIEYCFRLRDSVKGVDGFTSCGSIEEECVHVEVCYLVSEGYLS